MTKKRRNKNRLTLKGLVSRQFRDDLRDEERRRTLRARTTRPRLLTPEQRAAAEENVSRLLADWRLSPFEREADCRHGLRSGFCESGHSWHESDDEAAALVAAALNANGSQRPTWEQGQPEYVVPREQCNWCRSQLDDHQMGRGARFCSAKCAKLALDRRDYERRWQESELGRAAHRLVKNSRGRAKDCQRCGRNYYPTRHHPDQKFCSKTCSHGEKRTVPEIACVHCGSMFLPKNVDGAFCSKACYTAHGPTTKFDRNCEVCGEHFISASSKARFCGVKCRCYGNLIDRGIWNPKRLTPLTFDHFILLPTLGLTPQLNVPHIEPHSFDKLFCAPDRVGRL